MSLALLLVLFGLRYLTGQFLGDTETAIEANKATAVTTIAETVQSETATETETPETTTAKDAVKIGSADGPTAIYVTDRKIDSIDDLVDVGLLEEITDKNNKVIGWKSKAGLFYGMGSKEGNRVYHVFAHLKPDESKPIHSVFNTDKAGLIVLIDEAWLKKDTGYTKAQSNGNRIYDIDMDRVIGTNDEEIIRIVIRDGTEKIITAYPKAK